MDIPSTMRTIMVDDIEKCKAYPTVEGSGQYLNEIIAKYSIFDSDFRRQVCPVGKITVPGHECDYRKELAAAAARLDVMLLQIPIDKKQKTMDTFQRLVDQIPEIEAAFSDSLGGVKIVYNKEVFATWREKIKFEVRKMRQDNTISELLVDLDGFNGWNDVELFNSVSAKCRIISDNIDTYCSETKNDISRADGNKIFIVHGHDTEAKVILARTIEQLELDAVILHEQPDEGKTIIEKLETYTSEAAFAIVLYTECDIGRAKERSESDNQYRARQNVVFEHGLFIGALGRNRVCALVKGHIERPGDIDGIVYVPMDDAGAWKMQLCKNLKAVGIDADMNKLV